MKVEAKVKAGAPKGKPSRRGRPIFQATGLESSLVG